jgi:O-antigen/teichoic acid export membrane protein
MLEGRESPVPDVLGTPEAGGKAIRGGVIRIAGYGLGLVMALVSVPLLTRHLGVAEFGGYVAVLSLAAIVSIVSDAGLTVVGIRDYAVADADHRRRLVANIVSLRMIIATVGVLLVTGFAVVAGYDSSLVAGTALAGAGVLLALVQQTYTIPLASELRWGLVTALELFRQALSVVAILALIGAGAGVTAFLGSAVPVGLVAVAATAFAVRRAVHLRPGVDLGEWRRLVRAAFLVAVASILAALFYRVAIIMISVLSTERETGYFSASFRVIEVVVSVASLVTTAAFPILVRAASDERDRFVYGMQRLFEIGLILGAWTALVLYVGADPVMQFIGGAEFDPAVPVLQIQGLAAGASFLFAVWAAGLWAVGGQRALGLATLIGVISVGVLSAALVPSHGAVGAAAAMTVSEALLAAITGLLLLREGHVRIKVGIVPKVGVALGGALLMSLLGFPQLLLVVLATVAYVAVLALLGGVPPDIRHAFLQRKD